MAKLALDIYLKLICLLTMTMSEVQGEVKPLTDLSDLFDCNTSLQKGGGIFCLLFNIEFQKVKCQKVKFQKEFQKVKFQKPAKSWFPKYKTVLTSLCRLLSLTQIIMLHVHA